MKLVPDWMWDTWNEGMFVGDNRPNARVTISKTVLKKDASNFRTLLFNDGQISYELPNIRSVTIDRRVQADAANCTIVMGNQIPVVASDNLDLAHDGTASSPTRRELKDLGKPGYYTFRRGLVVGKDQVTNPWNHEVDGTWVDMLIPNRLVKVFQGYGTDDAGTPSSDSRLTLTGMFLIDRVEFRTQDNTIIITCRDFAKLLIEQRLYPPIVPLDDYPLEIEAEHTEYVEEAFFYDALPTTFGEEATPVSSYHGVPSDYTFGDSSVAPYYGFNAEIFGHRASHAFDSEWSSYWLSVGYNEQNATWSYAWLSAANGGNWINRVQFVPLYGGHKVYLSIKVGGSWIGGSTIPASNFPVYYNGADIPYVQVATVPTAGEYFVFELDYSYQVDEVRLTFTNLQYDGRGDYPYRAGVREFQCYNVSSTGDPIINRNEGVREVAQVVPGNITDYSEIVKLFTAWAGFWWPAGPHDPFFDLWGGPGSGRVWGDFFYSGAYPVAPPTIPPSYWDNKSIMDGINQIKEILGFVFYIDSFGGVVWRPPNIWKTGNFITGQGYVGEDSVPEIDEDKVLIDYGVTIDDANLRSDIIVVSADDPSVHGSFEPGFASGETIPTTIDTSDSALLGGQQRIMLVPNYPFGTADNPQSQIEVEKFAFLVSLWIHWSYRTARIRIPGMPALEPDDQIRLKERITSDTYIHYVQGINSTMDLVNGTWYMDLDTHWLGAGPSSEWVVNAKDMHPALFAYLREVGQIASEVEDDTSLWPDDWFSYQQPTVPDDIQRLDEDLDVLFPVPPEIVYAAVTTDFESEYGDDYTEEPTSTGGGKVKAGSNSFYWEFWGNGPLSSNPTTGTCSSSNIVSYKLLRAFDGNLSGNTHLFQNQDVWIRCHRNAIPAYARLADLIIEEQYVVDDGTTDSYSCRGVNIQGNVSTTTWSSHSWGVSLDLNWAANPQGSKTSDSTLITIGSKAHNYIRTGNGKPVFVWGNYFSTPDPMHFQINCTPQDIATGVVNTF